MNEIVLNGILNLFSMQAARLGDRSHGTARTVLETFLRDHLGLALRDQYLQLFDEALLIHKGSSPDLLFERARGVAAQLGPLLPRFDQYVFLLRCMELAVDAGDEGMTFPSAVGEELGIEGSRVQALRIFCECPFDPARLTIDFLLIGFDPAGAPSACRYLQRPGFSARACVLRVADIDTCFITPAPGHPITLDSVALPGGRAHLIPPGAILRDDRGQRIYASEVEAVLRESPMDGGGLSFQGENLEFRYRGTEIGLHRFSFCQKGGQLVGVMGVSGAGKSTLLSILNGQLRPDSGRVLVNGLDLHQTPDALEGMIGYVPQDDLLFEDLTVFENLYYNACLCLANLTPEERVLKVERILEELHQTSIRNLKVGSPLEKTISGGQRKRLNIALELVREPAILFLDEPTSGLSSSDSENVMALLKTQASKGRLVIVVIHQPSSRIYRMFDTIWILDEGGQPIYDGNPLDAITYFRSAVYQAGMQEYSCSRCGNVNPEQLFEIIEARTVDRNGRYTKTRRVSPDEWHRRFLEARQDGLPWDMQPASGPTQPPSSADASGPSDTAAVVGHRRLWRPGPLGQLLVFFRRQVKGRLANRQYLLVNLLEPPLLAVLTAVLVRGRPAGGYVFSQNRNLSVYFFISVIVALFLGLSVNAAEINRDRKILKREQFLHLSWPCYATSKAVYACIVATLQMAIFTLIGNSILAIPDMFWMTWMVLSSCAVTAAMLSLNVSAVVKSAVAIYILIPLLLVPQMLLGGSVIPFDDLIPSDSGNRNTPLAGNLMPSRWGYEALLVEQYTANRYMRNFLDSQCRASQSEYIAEVLLPEIRGLADAPFVEPSPESKPAPIGQTLRTLAGEVQALEARTSLRSDLNPGDFAPGSYALPTRRRIRAFLERVEALEVAKRDEALERSKAVEDGLRLRLGRRGLQELKDNHYNQDVGQLAMNSRSLEFVRRSGDRLVQVNAPICQVPESRWGAAHLLARSKRLGQHLVPTPFFNLGIISIMAVVFYAALFFSRVKEVKVRLQKLIRLSFVTVAIIVVCLSPCLADQALSLKNTAKIMREQYGGVNLEQMLSKRIAWKQAGLSYQESLMVPLQNVVDCKDVRGLWVLQGMYRADASYALTFGKMDRYVAIQDLLKGWTMKRAESLGRLKLWQPPPGMVRALVEDPDSEGKRKALLKDLQKAVVADIDKAEKDAQSMESLVQMIFGTVTQVTYIVCKLAVDAGAELAPVFNGHADELDKFAAVIDSFAVPDAVPVVDRRERSELIHFIRDLIRSRKGNLSKEDVRSILDKLEPLRDGYAKKCQ